MGPPRYGHPESALMQRLRKLDKSLNIDGTCSRKVTAVFTSKFYGQAERAISNGKLNVLLRLHIRPIKQVVFLCSY